MKRSRKLRALLGRSRGSISDDRCCRLLCACSQRPRDCRAAKSGYELPPPDAECHSPAAPSLTGSPLRQEYHAPTGRSVTSFTVVRDERARLFCGAKCPRFAPFRTGRDVRPESATRCKTDIGGRAADDQFDLWGHALKHLNELKTGVAAIAAAAVLPTAMPGHHNYNRNKSFRLDRSQFRPDVASFGY
jgi:hypothetical protein